MPRRDGNMKFRFGTKNRKKKERIIRRDISDSWETRLLKKLKSNKSNL